jgi:hypothetical protein
MAPAFQALDSCAALSVELFNPVVQKQFEMSLVEGSPKSRGIRGATFRQNVRRMNSP